LISFSKTVFSFQCVTKQGCFVVWWRVVRASHTRVWWREKLNKMKTMRRIWENVLSIFFF